MFLMIDMCSLMCTTVYIVRHVCHVCRHVWTQVDMGRLRWSWVVMGGLRWTWVGPHFHRRNIGSFQ